MWRYDIVGGLGEHVTCRHFGKNVKSQYLRDRFTDFDEIWQVDANWLLTRLLKFRIFENLIWRRLPSLKSQKKREITATDGRFSQNLALWCKMGLLTVQTI